MNPALLPLLFLLIEGGGIAANLGTVPLAKRKELEYAERDAKENRKLQSLQAAMLLAEEEKDRARAHQEKIDAASLLASEGMHTDVKAGALATLQDMLMAQDRSTAGFEDARAAGSQQRYMADLQAQQLRAQAQSESPLRLLGLL